MAATPDTFTASAPGKVLVCGGYAILQDTLAGLVVAASSRFFARAAWAPARGGGAERTFDVGLVMMATGRKPRTEGLGIEVGSPGLGCGSL